MKQNGTHRRVRCRSAGHAGMTLLELMIALAVIAVLAAFAVPVYQRHLARGHRAAAVAALQRAVQYVERSQSAFVVNTGGSNDAAVPPLPADLAHSPGQGAPVYRIVVSAGDPEDGGYLISAQPVAGSAMSGDAECGTFAIDAAGRRSNRGVADDERAAAICWSLR